MMTLLQVQRQVHAECVPARSQLTSQPPMTVQPGLRVQAVPTRESYSATSKLKVTGVVVNSFSN